MMNRRKMIAGFVALGAVSALPLHAVAQERQLSEEELRRLRLNLKRRRVPESDGNEDRDLGPNDNSGQGNGRNGTSEDRGRDRDGNRNNRDRPPAGQRSPDAATIERQLNRAPRRTIRREDRIDRRDFPREFRRRREIRIEAPSIDIQTINFEFGSANIPRSEFWKVEEIAIALGRFLRRNRDELFVIEGHTDAVGSRYSNQILSERRAASLKRVLVRNFGIPSYALETVGFGEDELLVRTPYADWRNRRVTLRRVTDFLR
jgi:outer membrane protein OmpA-like peptidoglycan-associated protein